MRARPTTLLVMLLLIVAGCSHRPPEAMNPTARTYLSRALDLLQQNSVDTGSVDWPRARAEAFRMAGGARNPNQTYPAIRWVVQQLHNPHTRFLSPTTAAESSSRSRPSGGPPTGRLLPDRQALLTILAADGGEDSYVRDGASIVRELDGSRPCGWIVDLRANGGGALGPMLTVLAPLLTGAILGYFVYPSGRRVAWSLRGGRLFIGDRADSSRANPYRLSRPASPIAILTAAPTASAAEATLISFRGQPNVRSFGQPTAGRASGNIVYPLSDGAALQLTVADEADRTGHVYPDRTPIPPDQSTPKPPAAGSVTRTDPGLTAATRWLSATGSCQP
jgi:carboxyl-terminal processing protease